MWWWTRLNVHVLQKRANCSTKIFLLSAMTVFPRCSQTLHITSVWIRDIFIISFVVFHHMHKRKSKYITQYTYHICRHLLVSLEIPDGVVWCTWWGIPFIHPLPIDALVKSTLCLSMACFLVVWVKNGKWRQTQQVWPNCECDNLETARIKHVINVITPTYRYIFRETIKIFH